MKFGKQLILRAADPKWSQYYLDYKMFKKFIRISYEELKNNNYDTKISRNIHQEFYKRLTQELEKIDNRYNVIEKKASESLKILDESWKDEMSDGELNEWRKSLLQVITALEELQEYVQINMAAIQKIKKKFDKNFKFLSNNLPAKASANVLKAINASCELLNVSYSPITPKSEKYVTSNFHFEAYNYKHDIGSNDEEIQNLMSKFKFMSVDMNEYLLNKARELWRKRTPPPQVPEESPNIKLLTLDDSEIPTTTCLDLESLPRGRISKLWISLIEDALKPLSVPVLVARGVKHGPVVGLTCALHGNEVNGIRVVHRLYESELNPESLHGTIVAVTVANIQGFLTSSRGFKSQDLNRLMPGKKNGSTAQQYAYNFIERIVKKFDYLIDLHTASKGRVNSLYVRANMLDDRTRKMAVLQNPQIIVHNTSPDGSLRGAAMAVGIPAITVEIGNPSIFQKRFVKNALLGVSNIISHLGMIPDEHQQAEFKPVICDKSYWIFTTKGGILSVIPEVNTWVRKGEIIATIHSIFGQLIETYTAPEDCIIVGKEIDPVASSGSRIAHIGVCHGFYSTGKVDDGHM
ncbi:uncharacterized protein T551_01152 [Pneumocystis jirovecii RU7]|uniref:SPX domain-containing protein n=1 Tax=Pneumocystis jirovecii (strain RU7) TaxID=1408657 RepID=A0A0W4ZU74_PNEJ7|nr:uncharacterized protein T551_01152 [Pneumocystis jirovecii RU7]KTW31891.1 hypothetical protein T551_01152 [Pneumocystis jirovecii RU7]